MVFGKLFGSGAEDNAAEIAAAETVRAAQAHFDRQLDLARETLADLPGATEYLAETRNVLALELPFVWGWLHAQARANPDAPGSASESATARMEQYLCDRHGLHWLQARDEAARLDAMWNAADPLFDAISRRGEESHAAPDRPVLADLFRAVLDNGSAG